MKGHRFWKRLLVVTLILSMVFTMPSTYLDAQADGEEITISADEGVQVLGNEGEALGNEVGILGNEDETLGEEGVVSTEETTGTDGNGDTEPRTDVLDKVIVENDDGDDRKEEGNERNQEGNGLSGDSGKKVQATTEGGEDTGSTSSDFDVPKMGAGVISALGAGIDPQTAAPYPYDETVYDPGDVAVINQIIANNGLAATPDDPASWDFASWESGKIEKLFIWGKGLFGDLDLRGLDGLIDVRCMSNQLKSLNLSGLSKLLRAYCSDNPLEKVIFPGGGDISFLNPEEGGEIGFSEFNMDYGSSVSVKLSFDLDPDFTFDSWESGGLATEEWMIGDNIAFSPSTPNITIKPVLWRTYDKNDVAVINKIIQENGLEGSIDDPTSWEDIVWKKGRVTNLYFSYKDISGDLDLKGLTQLEHLDCDYTNVNSIDMSGLDNLDRISCDYSPLTSITFPNSFSLSIESSEGGLGTIPSFQGTSYNGKLGLGIGFKATPDEGYLFDVWEDSNNILVGTSSPELSRQSTLMPTSDIVIKPIFVPTYSSGDIAVINKIITDNGLAEELDSPEKWGGWTSQGGFLTWTKGRITSLSLNRRNLFGSLDVSGLSELKYLDCDSNQLTGLNVYGLTKLSSLSCRSNKLASLEINGLINLGYFDCSSNQLKSLNLTGLNGLSTLICASNQLNSLDISNMISLRVLNCDFNKLVGTLDASGSKALRELKCGGNGDELIGLNVSNLTDLEYLGCAGNEITDLDLEGMKKLESLSCAGNQLTSLNTSDLVELRYLECNNNRLTGTLDISASSKLYRLTCQKNQLDNIVVGNLSQLVEFDCSENKLTSLDASGLPKLAKLDCSKNLLGSLNVIGSGDDMDQIYFSVDCSDNLLTSLDVSNMSKLSNLNCSSNKLNEIKLSGAVDLGYLNCNFNQLKRVDVKGLTNFRGLYCDQNPIESIILPAGNSIAISSSVGGTVRVGTFGLKFYDGTFDYGLFATADQGHTFTKWEATGIKLPSPTSASASNASIPTGDVLIKGIFDEGPAPEYTVRWFWNDGASALPWSTIKVEKGTAFAFVTEFSTRKSREGFVFDGWYTAATGGTKITATTAVTGDMDLYAHWTQASYTIAFDGNGSTSGAMANQSMLLGVASKLTANAYAKTGHTFAGWNTKADGSGTSYSYQALVTDLTATIGDTVTLFAQWKKTIYTVYFNGNYTNAPTATNKTVEYGDEVGGFPNLSREGYRIEGWFTAATGGIQVYSTELITQGRTFYAHWTPIAYTVKFDGNSAQTGAMVDMDMIFGTPMSLSVNVFAREDSDFLGWNTKADGTGAPYSDNALVSNLSAVDGDTVILYAQWGIKKYTVLFDLNGGIGKAPEDRTVVHGDAVGNLPDVTRDGYAFDGWYTARTEGMKISGTDTVTKTQILYARWLGYTYTLSFDANGGTDVMDDQINVTNGVDKLSANTFKRENSLFAGWNTSADGTGQVYGDEAVADFPEADGANITLYAQWMLHGYFGTGLEWILDEKSGSFEISKTTGTGDILDYTTNYGGYGGLIQTAVVRDGVVKLEDGTFSNLQNLEKVTLEGTSITGIGTDAFINCPKLASIFIPNSVVNIADGAFAGSTTILQGYYDSYAIWWAMENGLSYEIIPYVSDARMDEVALNRGIPAEYVPKTHVPYNTGLVFSVSPALPAGMKLATGDASDNSGKLPGTIYGTPAVTSTRRTYTLTAVLPEDADLFSATVTFAMAVSAPPADIEWINWYPFTPDPTFGGDGRLGVKVGNKYVVNAGVLTADGGAILHIGNGNLAGSSFYQFKALYIDGIERNRQGYPRVNPNASYDEYFVEDGSTRVTIMAKTLEALDDGKEHEVVATFRKVDATNPEEGYSYEEWNELPVDNEVDVVAQRFTVDLKVESGNPPISPDPNPTPGPGEGGSENTGEGSDSGSGSNTGNSEETGGSDNPSTGGAGTDTQGTTGTGTSTQGATGGTGAGAGTQGATGGADAGTGTDGTDGGTDANDAADDAGDSDATDSTYNLDGRVLSGFETDSDGNPYFDWNGVDDMVVRIDIDLDEFRELHLNGSQMTQGDDFEATSGSTILTIPASRIEEMEEGRHVLAAHFASEVIEMAFDLRKPDLEIDSATPETEGYTAGIPGSTGPAVWLFVLVIGSVAIGGAVIFLKKRNMK